MCYDGFSFVNVFHSEGSMPINHGLEPIRVHKATIEKAWFWYCYSFKVQGKAPLATKKVCEVQLWHMEFSSKVMISISAFRSSSIHELMGHLVALTWWETSESIQGFRCLSTPSWDYSDLFLKIQTTGSRSSEVSSSNLCIICTGTHKWSCHCKCLPHQTQPHRDVKEIMKKNPILSTSNVSKQK